MFVAQEQCQRREFAGDGFDIGKMLLEGRAFVALILIVIVFSFDICSVLTNIAGMNSAITPNSINEAF